MSKLNVTFDDKVYHDLSSKLIQIGIFFYSRTEYDDCYMFKGYFDGNLLSTITLYKEVRVEEYHDGFKLTKYAYCDLTHHYIVSGTTICLTASHKIIVDDVNFKLSTLISNSIKTEQRELNPWLN